MKMPNIVRNTKYLPIRKSTQCTTQYDCAEQYVTDMNWCACQWRAAAWSRSERANALSVARLKVSRLGIRARCRILRPQSLAFLSHD